MASLCCGSPGLLFAGYFLGWIFRNLACLESSFSLLLLLLFFSFFEQFNILRFLFSNARWNALDDLSTRKYRVCEDLWIGYNLTCSPKGALPIMAKTEGSARKGYLIFGLWVHETVGISLVEVYKRVEKSVILSVKGAKMANRRILLMLKETLTSWCSDFFILKDAEFASVKREVNLWNGYY